MDDDKFSVIVIDPPYSFSDRLVMDDVARGAEANYNVMSIDEIKKLPIAQIANPKGAVIALWVPSSLLQEGLDIMSSYGFKHKQTFVWVKTKKDIFKDAVKGYVSGIESTIKSIGYVKKHWKEYFNRHNKNMSLDNILSFGMGRLFRQTHEICLIGINNTGIYKQLQNKSQRSVCFAENLKHSAKPENLQNSLDMMFPNSNKIEIFARRPREGWLCLGNQSPTSLGEDIRDSLNKLINKG